ncbi:MAG: Uma2 family endonuclease, partial [Fimbriiglobus sp.]
MTATTLPSRKPPPLANGDHLTAAEFRRRYEAMPNVRAELIEGVVYMSSPVRLTEHGEQHIDLITWLGVYKAGTPGLRTGDNATVKLDTDNEPQPDVVAFIDPARGGTAVIDAEGYLVGPPEFVGEVSASSASIDRNSKFRVYQANGVRDYFLWLVYDATIE